MRPPDVAVQAFGCKLGTTGMASHSRSCDEQAGSAGQISRPDRQLGPHVGDKKPHLVTKG